MFAPPAVIEAEVFARLPEAFRKAGRCAWGDANNGRRPTDCFLEGPAFDRQGDLWVTDIPHGRVFRIDPKGKFELAAQYDGEPNGLKIHRDGRIFITDYRRGLMLLDPASGRVSELVGRRHTESFKGVNDLTLASNGDIYFTDQGQTGLHDPTGRVYRLAAGGQLQLLLGTVPSPNGIVLDSTETVLFVAATRGNCVWRAPIMDDGTLSKVGLFVQLSGGIGPDGLAMDENDGLVVAHAGLGGAWIFDKAGIPTHFVKSSAGELTTNVAFGGADRRDLYIVESATGSILRARVPVAGRRLHSHLT